MEDPSDVNELDPVPALVERAKRGDKDAFGQLYRLHHAAVFRLAHFRLGTLGPDRTDAEDIVAEVFLRAWKALPNYRERGAPFAAWLYGIARHVVVDELRRRGRSETREELPDRGVEWHEDERIDLEAAIGSLPEEQRQVIELKYLVGLRNADIAKALGSTPGAVNTKQWRALASLREHLTVLEEGR